MNRGPSPEGAGEVISSSAARSDFGLLLALKNAPAATKVLKGPELLIDFVSAAHERLFGSAGWVGKPLAAFAMTGPEQELLKAAKEVLRTGATIEIDGLEASKRDVSGGKRFLRFVCGPIFMDGPAPVGVVCQGFDLTDAYIAQRRRATLVLLGEQFRELDNPDDLAFAAAEILGRTLDVSRAGYGTIDLAAETIRIERDWNAAGVASLAGTLRFRDYGSYIDDLRAGRTVVIDDAMLDPRTADSAEALCLIQARAVVNMPVIELSGVAALLYLNHAEARNWSPDELSLIKEVAEVTRAAVARRHAEIAVRDNEARLQFLDQLGKLTASSVEADEILTTTTRSLGEYLGVTVCAYADMDEDQDGFTIRGDWSAPGSRSIVGRYSLAAFGRLAVQNLGAGRPLILNDIRSELALEEAETFLGIGLAATICMPLVKQGRLTALMAIHDDKPRRWTEGELSLLTEVTERSWAHIERVRAEASIRANERRFREELEAKVAERTHALQQVQKMEAVGNLTGGVAHDFNNLLMAITGSLELLRKRLPNEAGLLRLLDNAMEGARRGSSLTQRMLAFARRQELKTERTQVATLVEGMTDLLQRSLGPMIQIVVEIPESLPSIDVDINQLESALLNLAVNSRDAMPNGGRLLITAREGAPPGRRGLSEGGYICISIADDGEGMDEATLGRATEPFFTTKGVGKGTGLGLSMVYGLAEQSGGSFDLESVPGSGTRANIWLPAALPAGAARADIREISRPDTSAGSRKLSILAVDDDALVLMNTGDLLEDLGHEVVLAYSGAEALERLGEQQFDLLVTDHAMPRMTGAQLIAEVRVRKPGLPVLMVTGYADLPAQSGLVDFPRLSKPFSQAQLKLAVDTLMSAKST